MLTYDLEEALIAELLCQGLEISLESSPIDFELVEELESCPCDSPVLLQGLPHAGSDIVETEIETGGQIQKDGFVLQFPKDDLLWHPDAQ